jgi:hypothetical protein
MSWNSGTSLSGYVGSIETYYESRQNPENPEKQQIRKRLVIKNIFPGVNLATAQDRIVGFPSITISRIWTRRMYAVGGGGYNIEDTTDYVYGDWEDAPEA